MWEIITEKGPWEGLDPVEAAIKVISEGARLEIPENTEEWKNKVMMGEFMLIEYVKNLSKNSQKLPRIGMMTSYIDIITACWQSEPENRPSFATLCNVIAAETGLGQSGPIGALQYGESEYLVAFLLKFLNEFTDSRGSGARVSKQSDARSSNQKDSNNESVIGSEYYTAILAPQSSNVLQNVE
jgi:hypothetical protein